MKPARPTLEEYRTLSAEERELVRLGDARAFATGKLKPTPVKRRKVKNRKSRSERGSTWMKAQLELDALFEAQRAVSVHFYDLLKKQIAIFEEVTAEAHKHFDATKIGAETAEAHTEAAKAAFLKWLTNMQALAEANAAVNETASALIRESLAELRTIPSDTTGPTSPR